MQGEFSVYQFFPNGMNECVRHFVSGPEAMDAFLHYIQCVGAKIGTTNRVIITDGGDCCAMEWKHGEGITFPDTPEMKIWNQAILEGKRIGLKEAKGGTL